MHSSSKKHTPAGSLKASIINEEEDSIHNMESLDNSVLKKSSIRKKDLKNGAKKKKVVRMRIPGEEEAEEAMEEQVQQEEKPEEEEIDENGQIIMVQK